MSKQVVELRMSTTIEIWKYCEKIFWTISSLPIDVEKQQQRREEFYKDQILARITITSDAGVISRLNRKRQEQGVAYVY